MESLYTRLGGIYAIAAVVDYFSEQLIDNPVVGKDSKNPILAQWHTESLDRLAGLKFQRILWVSEITGGPYKYVPTVKGSANALDLGKAHSKFKITSEEFDEVAEVLKSSMIYFDVPAKEIKEVLAAFNAHKKEVTGQRNMHVHINT